MDLVLLHGEVCFCDMTRQLLALLTLLDLTRLAQTFQLLQLLLKPNQIALEFVHDLFSHFSQELTLLR